MSVHRRTAAIVIARQTRQYKMGDKVRIIRGPHAGRLMTIGQSANDWVTLDERNMKDPSRYMMSKGNVEPLEGFTDDEMNQAKRISEKLWRSGSIG